MEPIRSPWRERAEYGLQEIPLSPNQPSNDGIYRLQSHVVHLSAFRGDLTPYRTTPAPSQNWLGEISSQIEFIYGYSGHYDYNQQKDITYYNVGRVDFASTFDQLLPNGDAVEGVGVDIVSDTSAVTSNAAFAPNPKDFQEFHANLRILPRGGRPNYPGDYRNYGPVSGLAIRVTECRDTGAANYGPVSGALLGNSEQCVSHQVGPDDADDTAFFDFH